MLARPDNPTNAVSFRRTVFRPNMSAIEPEKRLSVEDDVAALFGMVTRASFFRELAPELHIDGPAAITTTALDPRAASAARATLSKHGYFSLSSVVSRSRVDLLASATRALYDRKVPTCFLFAYDEAWALGFELEDALHAVLGSRYHLVPDVWAWLIEPIATRRGWRPHRGTYVDDRRADGAPSVINLWLALSEVTAETACMHVVPLDADPHFPGELKSVEFDERSVVALPCERGTLLGWNSNVLHYGGEMTEAACEARLSLSYTLRDRREPPELERVPTFEERIDLLAQMIAIYGDQEGAELAAARQWAKLHLALHALGTERARR